MTKKVKRRDVMLDHDSEELEDTEEIDMKKCWLH